MKHMHKISVRVGCSESNQNQTHLRYGRQNFERDKQDLIYELLMHNQKIESSVKISLGEDRPQSKKCADRSEHRITEQKEFTLKDMLPSCITRTKQANNQTEAVYFDQYAEELKEKKKAETSIKFQSIKTDSECDYELLDNFVRPKTKQESISTTYFNSKQIKDREPNNNQKSEILDSFIKSGLQPHNRKIRKTERQPNQHNQQSTIKKQGARRPEQTSSKPQISSTQRQINKQISPQLNRQLMQMTSFKLSETSQERQPKRNERKSHQNQDWPSQKSNSYTEKQQLENQTQKIYDYDQESNIFTKLESKKPINIEQIKDQFRNVKQAFKIKNEAKFKQQIFLEDMKFHPKKPETCIHLQTDLFNGCTELSMRRHLSKIDKKQQKLSEKHQSDSNIENEDQAFKICRRQKKESDKTSQISAKNKNEEIKFTKSKISQSNKLSKPSAQKLNQNGLKFFSNVQKSQEVAAKIGESSSECSFSKLKVKVTASEINKVNSLVSETVKAVASNLAKTVGNDKRSEAKGMSEPSKLHQSSSLENLVRVVPNKLPNFGQTQSIFKVFGQTKNERKLEQSCQSIDFFSKLPNGDALSNPSTVKILSEKSEDRSEMMKHIKDLESYSIDSQIFKKDELETNKNNEQKQQSVSEKTDQKPVAEKQELNHSYEPIYASISQWRPSHANASELKEIQLSEDAISLGKFEDAPAIHSSSQNEAEAVKAIEVQKSKAKRVQIEPDSESSGSSQDDQSFQAQPRKNEQSVDLDDLDDYNSDEQEQKVSQGVRRTPQPFPKVLAPVAEEDLEQSEYRRIQSKKQSSRQA